MKRNSCYTCGYCKKEEWSGEVQYYCNDRDCIIDPTDPDCNWID